MSNSPRQGQLELGINRTPERDRNFHLGGRSFYFFDFDDNIAFLTTPLILFHKQNRHEIAISSGDFAQHHATIGQSGLYADYQIDYCDMTGTFRNFRDSNLDELQKLSGQKQVFVQDVAQALNFPIFNGKAPLGVFLPRVLQSTSFVGDYSSWTSSGNLERGHSHLPFRITFTSGAKLSQCLSGEP